MIPQLLERRAATNGATPFLACGAEAVSFAEMADRAEAVAAGLHRAGIRPGDRVAILAPNRPEVLDVFFGCARLGAVQVPLNAFLKGEFLRHQLQDCQASTLVTDAQGFTAAAPLVPQLGDLRQVILLDPTGEPCPLPSINYEDLLRAGNQCPVPPPEAGDLMSIVYTSGTTGLPKGCMLTHGYYLRVARRTIEAFELQLQDVLFTALPLFHGAARMMVVTAALEAGITAVVEPEFRPGPFLHRLAETGATVVMGVGAMGAALLGLPPSTLDRDHRLRLAVWIPFPEAQQLRFEERFGVPTLAEFYGQTECVPITFSRPSGERNRNSAGQPAPDLDVRLLDDDGAAVPVGVPGEIVVRARRAHALFAGYWGAAPAGEWHHTGDYGCVDSAGFIAFVDRKKDALRRRGENISSLELEAAVSAHPKIAEAAVHAVPSALTEDDIKVCVVPAGPEVITADELFAFFRETLPYYAIPRYVEVMAELPKNAVGRVMKHLLRERGVTPETWDFDDLGLTVGRSERR